LEDFSAKVSEGLAKLDRSGQREIIRALVRRIEIDGAAIEIIFRVPPPNAPGSPTSPEHSRATWQQCAAVRRANLRLAWSMPPFGERLRESHSQRLGVRPPRNNPPHAPKIMFSKLNFPDRL
jgi:hypothetical protein